MSILKSALVACVMTTSAMLLGYMAPAAIKAAHAQAVPFPPCHNDYRAEIASGQRSQHYPRCVDDHGIPGRFMSTQPQFATLPGNCPSGQVYSGGACVRIQNQGIDAHWAKAFVGQTQCASSPVTYVIEHPYTENNNSYISRYSATPCVSIQSAGRFLVRVNNESRTIVLDGTSTPNGSVETWLPLYHGGIVKSYVAPIYDRWNGGAITSWAVHGVNQ